MTEKLNINGRILCVEKVNSHKWEAWWEDDHSIITEARTRRQVIEDA